MRVMTDFTFKQRKGKKGRQAAEHTRAVCELIICNTETSQVVRKVFTTWEAAREYRDEKSQKYGRRYRMNIERL